MPESTDKTATSGQDRFEKPELKFEQPSLTVHGDLSGVTKGFFGSFSP